MARRQLAALAGALVLVTGAVLSGCQAGTPSVEGPNESNVQVDTPEYRALKSGAGIENCPAAQTDDGGLPEVSLPCLGGGRRVDLSRLKGPLILNFWFAACEPCRKEMPVLAQFHRTYGDRVPVLGIDMTDTMPGAALELARDSKVTYPLVADPGGKLLETRLSGHGFPYFYFLGADGKLTTGAGKPAHSGGVNTLDDLVTLVEDNLEIDL